MQILMKLRPSTCNWVCPQGQQLHTEAPDVCAAPADPGGLARPGCAQVLHLMLRNTLLMEP